VSIKMELECFRIFDEAIAKIAAENKREPKRKVRVKKEKKRGA